MKITNSSHYNFPNPFSSCHNFVKKSFQTILTIYNTFFFQLSYFITLSLAGYLSLSVFTNPKSNNNTTKTSYELDLFFTSVSASTVSSMSVLEMEIFSNSQLIILTILMLFGGEIFTSFLGIQIQNLKLSKKTNPSQVNVIHDSKTSPDIDCDNRYMKLKSLSYLGYVVLGYLLVVHISGSLFVYSYFLVFSSARKILKNKGIEPLTFAIFATVSTFSNCGFIPTKENMIVFKKNSGLLLTLMFQVLLGNTLFPVFLRIVLWFLKSITKKREFNYMMRNNREMGYDHLLCGSHSVLVALTALVFVSVQLALFCTMEWGSEELSGLGLYEKFVASLFQVVNSRHAGESVVDISLISPAILGLFVIMMYLPPYTTFVPTKENDEENISTNGDPKSKKTLLECLTFSNLSFLSIFVVLICITERESIKNDPLNFNVLNIIIEVISAYGNVGFSTGYSCKRQLNQDGNCRDMWFGFSGKWTSEGKFVLIIVMFFGRLKKFNMKKGGKAWKFF